MADSASRGRGPTIYSVAEAAGVSIATVSRVLQHGPNVSDNARSKVLKAAADLDYVPHGAARSLAVQRHEAHGIVLPDISGPYYAELIMGYESRAAELGRSVVIVLADWRGDPSTAVRALATRVDGIVFVGRSSVEDTMVRQLGALMPVVVVARDEVEGVDSIRAENTPNARALTTHLMDQHGRRDLLFVGSPDRSPDTRDRYAGFVAAHAAAGRPPADPVRIRLDEAAGSAFADDLLAGRYEADGVVCANDELALAVIDRVQSHGWRVPDEMAVVGWDDVLAARYIRPALTTVRQPVRELGISAADALHARLSGGPLRPGPNILPTTLVVRGSCGCPTDPSAPPSTTAHRASARPRSANRKKEA